MKKLIFLAFFAMALPFVSFSENLGGDVIEVPAKFWKSKKPKDDFFKEMVYMLQLNNKYTLNKWYKERKKFDTQTTDYLDFAGTMEKDIRPTSHHIFALATSFKFNLYDPKVSGASLSEAKEVFHRLLSSVAYRHKANMGKVKGAWGNHWQSALWAGQVAMGGWMMWDELSPKEQELVLKMTEYEANRFIGKKIPYYRNEKGEIISKGNTRAEENAWNSSLITMAEILMPHHPNFAKWRKENILLQLSAYSIPADMTSEKVVDGFRMKDVLHGSNANADGTVVNHHILHPDYMTAIMFNVCNVWVCEMAKVKPLESSTHNLELVYKALTELKVKGKTMYQPTPEGKASIEIFFPEGNDWGGERQANYWLMDIQADYFGCCRGSSIKPLSWAKVRSVEMLRMMNRNSTGEYYQSQKEDKFFSREEWIGQHLAWGIIGTMLK